MKKTLLSAFIAITALSASYAQPIITAATNSPLAGDVYIGHALDSAYVAVGASGPAASWNFASVVDTASDTTTFSVCATTPYCDSFSGSNIAGYDGDFGYYNSNLGAFTAIGAFVSGTGAGTGYLHFTDPKDLMRFPFTYTNMYKDTTSFVTSGVNINIYDSSYADAYGTIVLPSGTFTNVLRVHNTSVTIATFMSMPVSTNQTETYIWYKPGFHNPLMTIDMDTTSGTLQITGAKYFTGPLYSTGVNDISVSNSGLQVYPNPATDAIHIKFSLAVTDAASVTIADITGRVVATINNDNMNKGSNDLSFSTSELSAGVYVIQLHTSQGIATQKVVVSK